ncbi:hypothetical protein CSOJ01_07094 [Colletotrichum sojae]|uniref:Uncharacterized protein n=1 Tax=Colletotrichum sojae TaxID=2175907 RepID=A0A8H6JA03_9PEZI|nr:hypothetical protein CSOJ01_07094 [Colletotrichum sojae]
MDENGDGSGVVMETWTWWRMNHEGFGGGAPSGMFVQPHADPIANTTRVNPKVPNSKLSAGQTAVCYRRPCKHACACNADGHARSPTPDTLACAGHRNGIQPGDDGAWAAFGTGGVCSTTMICLSTSMPRPSERQDLLNGGFPSGERGTTIRFLCKNGVSECWLVFPSFMIDVPVDNAKLSWE